MRIIKRYSNRKLYDTSKSGYVGLDDLLGFVRNGETVQVVRLEDGADLTAETLLVAMAAYQKKEAVGWPASGLHRVIRDGLAA